MPTRCNQPKKPNCYNWETWRPRKQRTLTQNFTDFQFLHGSTCGCNRQSPKSTSQQKGAHSNKDYYFQVQDYHFQQQRLPLTAAKNTTSKSKIGTFYISPRHIHSLHDSCKHIFWAIMTNIQMVLTLFIIDHLNNSVGGGRGLPETVNISSFSAVQVIRVTFSWQGVLNVKLWNILHPWKYISAISATYGLGIGMCLQ